MAKLTRETSEKLQIILSKRVGRQLSEIELEEAYEGLLGFALALIDLNPEIQSEDSVDFPSATYV